MSDWRPGKVDSFYGSLIGSIIATGLDLDADFYGSTYGEIPSGTVPMMEKVAFIGIVGCAIA